MLGTHQRLEVLKGERPGRLGPLGLGLGRGHRQHRTHLVEVEAALGEPGGQVGQVAQRGRPPGRRPEPWRQRPRAVGPARTRATSPRWPASPRAGPVRPPTRPARRLGSSARRRPGPPAPSAPRSRAGPPPPCSGGRRARAVAEPRGDPTPMLRARRRGAITGRMVGSSGRDTAAGAGTVPGSDVDYVAEVPNTSASSIGTGVSSWWYVQDAGSRSGRQRTNDVAWRKRSCWRWS